MKIKNYLLSPLVALTALPGYSLLAEEVVTYEEIVVTAQRREQNPQDVPVSITAFDSDRLENARLTSIESIAQMTPGFTGSNFNESSPIYAIRGVNNTFSSAGTSKPVGVFIDDVFISRNSAADFDLFDLEQVAVLRGPQGTLFGRNVSAGAVQITTAKPSLEGTQFKAKAGAGNLEFREIAALVNGPLSESAAAKLSISSKQRDGYIVDRFNGLDYNDVDTYSLRGQLLLQPTDAVEVTLALDYTKDDTHSRGFSFVENRGNTTGNDGNIRTAELNIPQVFDRDIFGVSVTAHWALSAGTFSSISAYRESDAREFYSLSPGQPGLTANFVQQVHDDDDKPETISQEFRFVSESGDTFDYVAGLFLYFDETDRSQINTRCCNFLSREHRHRAVADTDSYGLYGDVTFHLLGGAVDLSLGGRYTNEEVAIDISFIDVNNTARNFVANDSDSFSEFTSRISLTWFATETTNFFASRTEGFTGGGFNSEVDNPAVIQFAIDPETVTAYEVGMKSRWLEGRLNASLTLFQQDYEDKQEGFFNVQESIFSIFNASDATVEGAELEVSWIVSDSLQVNLSYAYLDTEYDRFQIPGGADFSGNELATAPQNTFSAALNYRQPIHDAGYLLVNAGYADVDEYFTGASNSADFLVGDYSLVNASIGYETADGRWRIDLWGNNLADEEYVLIRGTSFGIGEHFGAPRTYGATITYSLN